MIALGSPAVELASDQSELEQVCSKCDTTRHVRPGGLAHYMGKFSLVPMYLTQCGHANTCAARRPRRPACAHMFSHRCLYFISHHDNPQ